MRLARRTTVLLLGAGVAACEAGVAPSSTATAIQVARPRDADSVLVPSDIHGNSPGVFPQLFAIGGGMPVQLTFCDACIVLEAIPSPDRGRAAVRRIASDTNRNGRLDEGDRVNLALLDLNRRLEGLLLPETFSVQSADWSVTGGFFAHASIGPEGGLEDIFQVEANGQNIERLLQTDNVRERGVRINPAITRIAYERIEGSGPGKSEIWLYQNQFQLFRLTGGGTDAGDVLAGTLYRVGSDAGPAYAPDSSQVAFRRLVSAGVPGGAWDIYAIPVASGGSPRLIAGGDGRFRSNPDWNRDGIVFTETDPATSQSFIVKVDPQNGARTILETLRAGYSAGAPRWIVRPGA